MSITFPLTGFNVNAISTKGGDKFALRLVNFDGTAVAGSSSAWFDAFYRSKSTIMIEQPEDDIKGESGNVLTTEAGDVKAEIKITSLQSDDNFFNFLNVDTQNQYFAVFMHSGSVMDKQRFFYFPLTKIQRGFNFAQPGGETEVTIKPLNNASAFTGATLSGAGSSVTGWAEYNIAVCSLSGAASTYVVAKSV